MNQYLTNACGGCGSKKKKKGFTLIELLIVITIIGILAVALLPRVLNAPARTRDTARRTALARYTVALEAYYGDYGKYPDADSNSTTFGGTCLGGSGDTVAALLAPYFTGGELPVDPLGTTRDFGSGSSSNGLYDIPPTTACTSDTVIGFWYKDLTLKSTPQFAYVIAMDPEIDPATTAAALAPNYMSISGKLTTDTSWENMKTSVETGEASATLYAVLSE